MTAPPTTYSLLSLPARTSPRRNYCRPARHTQTRTNANSNGTEANAAGRSIHARVARESKRERSWGVGGRTMRLTGGRGVGECGSGKYSYGVAWSLK